MALSPGLVYFSRDFIHEMSFGCFSLGIVVGAWRYAESKKFIWLALMATSAGLLFATKETAIITAVVDDHRRRLRNSMGDHAKTQRRREVIPARSRANSTRLPGRGAVARSCAGGDHIFVFINIIFYASFFVPQKYSDGSGHVHWRGIRMRSNQSLSGQAAAAANTSRSFWYYIGILLQTRAAFADRLAAGRNFYSAEMELGSGSSSARMDTGDSAWLIRSSDTRRPG